jgi:hypothetical protein
MKQSSLIHRTMVALAALAGVAGTSQAANVSCECYEYTLSHNKSPLAFLKEPWKDSNGTPSYSSTWNLTGTFGGYTPSSIYTPNSHTFDKIEVTFSFADDDPGSATKPDAPDYSSADVAEYVSLKVGSVTIKLQEQVDGKHPESNYKPYSYDLKSILSPVDFQTVVADLMADGKLTYQVTILDISGNKYKDSRGNWKWLSEDPNREDTYLKVASIKAGYTYCPPEQNVPEGGASLALFGLTLAGLVGWRRRKS